MDSRLAQVSFTALAIAAWSSGCGSNSASPATTTHGGATDASATAVADAGVDAGPKPTVDSHGCPVNSGFVGDSRCLAPPSPSEGFQLHYAPVDYASPASEAPYLLQPGGEVVDCYYLKTPNTTDVYVGGYEISLRQGSHHFNIDINTTAQPDGLAICGANDNSPGLLGGTTIPVADSRADPAPENAGLAVKVPANSQAVLNFHVINTTTEPTLREAWANYYYMDQSQVKGYRGNIFLVGGLGYQITPGTKQTYTYSCSPDRPTRILDLSAHMHVHATRMTAWKVSGGQPSLVYETYDWSAPTDLHYDSVHTNSMPVRTTQTPGGSTGAIVLQPTDSLQWECEVDNTSNVTLTFRNEVYTGEMCIMTGTMVPADDPMNPDNFQCTLN